VQRAENVNLKLFIKTYFNVSWYLIFLSAGAKWYQVFSSVLILNLKFKYATTLLKPNRISWILKQKHLQSNVYLWHHSEGLSPCLQWDGAWRNAVNRHFSINGCEAQQSWQQRALPRTCSTQQTHLHTHTNRNRINTFASEKYSEELNWTTEVSQWVCQNSTNCFLMK